MRNDSLRRGEGGGGGAGQVDDSELVRRQTERWPQLGEFLLAGLGRKERVHARKIVTFQMADAPGHACTSTWAGLGWPQRERGRHTPRRTSPAAVSRDPATRQSSDTRRFSEARRTHLYGIAQLEILVVSAHDA